MVFVMTFSIPRSLQRRSGGGLEGPNAMIFGRGGGGGVINRVTKEAVFAGARDYPSIGSFDQQEIHGGFRSAP